MKPLAMLNEQLDSFRGAIAWAKFELPKAPVKAPQYRAGVEFTDADAKAIDNFCARNKT